MPKLDVQHLPPIGSPLSGVAPAAADNTADHGDYTQTWRWNLATPAKLGFLIKHKVPEIGGLGNSRELLRLEVGDSNNVSNVTPLSVYRTGTLAFQIARGSGSSGTVLAEEKGATTPTYAFTGSPTSGFTYASAQLQFSISASPVLALDASGNLKISVGNVGASQTNGMSMSNGTATSADPISAGNLSHNATTGFTYRSSVSNEGAGQNNLIHNRTSNIVGSGSNYTLSGSSSLLDFGTTDPSITLPTAGVFLLIAQIKYVADAVGAADVVKFKLRNTTDSADIGTERSFDSGTNSGERMFQLIETVTTTAASKVVQIWGYNSTSARGTITSTQTTLHYIRLS